jgi:hypothetical protein
MGPRDEREGRLAGVEVSEMSDLVGKEGATAAAPVGPAGHPGLEEEAVHDQLTAALEQIEQRRRAVRSIEAVVLLHDHPRQAAARGGERG